MTEFETEQAKYITFKADDYAQWMKDGRRIQGLPQPVDDAVVIRLKDPYASSALHAYTNAILTVLDLMADDLDPDTYQAQLDIADYFHQMAVSSSEIKGKRLPD